MGIIQAIVLFLRAFIMGRAAAALENLALRQQVAVERMQNKACTNMRSVHMVDGAGHWVQQEQPTETSRLLIEFLRD